MADANSWASRARGASGKPNSVNSWASRAASAAGYSDQKFKEQDEEKKRKKQAEAVQKKQEPQKKEWWQKGLEGVAKAFSTDFDKNVRDIIGVGKEGFVDPVAKVAQQITNSSIVQNENKGQAVVDDRFQRNQESEIQRALKAGEITKQRADELRKKSQKAVDTTKQSIKKAEKHTGVKYNQDEGATSAVDALSNLSGTGFITKEVGKLAQKTGSTIINKFTKKDIPETAIAKELKPPKPTQPQVQKEMATPQQVRATNYQIDKTKPRVTQKEAEQKLARAGYTTEESKKILEDVLPEKGLSMPGSPKKIGYKEDHILAAANEYDKTPPLDPTNSNHLVNETASKYNTVDDYVNEATDTAWKQNKKGTGTMMVEKHLDEIGTGSDSMRLTRVSDNHPYYRAVFEETGKAPTKTKIRQDITEFLDGKDNAARYLLDPEERGVVDLIRERQQSISVKDAVPEGAVSPDGSTLTPLAPGKTGETGASKLAASTKEEAVKEKIIKKTEAETVDTPQYNKANMKEQAEYATNLIKTNPEDAVEIAMGRKAPPEHILQQMVYNAVEDHAKKIGGDKGANLLLQLSRSRQSTNLTKMGQEIRAAAERDPHSPVTLLNEVKLARAEAAKKRGKDLMKAAQEDAKLVKAVTPKVKKEDWDSFVKGLEC